MEKIYWFYKWIWSIINDPKLVEALQKQTSKITHTSNLFFSQVMIDAGEKLIKASKMDKIFFINSG